MKQKERARDRETKRQSERRERGTQRDETDKLIKECDDTGIYNQSGGKKRALPFVWWNEAEN